MNYVELYMYKLATKALPRTHEAPPPFTQLFFLLSVKENIKHWAKNGI
jgi:hypothetical protein